MNIEKFNPCKEGLEYYKQFNSFKDAWNKCHRGDWMLWIASRLKVDIRLLTKAKALCAKTVEHLMKDERSIKALEVALLFSEDKATKKELNKAAAYTDAAATDAAYNATDAPAAYAAADAAHAAVVTSYTAAAAAAAFAAAYAADAAAATVERENQLLTANICREILTEAVMEAIDEYKKI